MYEGIFPIACRPFPVTRMVEGEGFEPSKAEPADLQSAPFDRSGTPPSKRAILAVLALPGQTTRQLRRCRGGHSESSADSKACIHTSTVDRFPPRERTPLPGL